jgi:hypothetical protein
MLSRRYRSKRAGELGRSRAAIDLIGALLER